MKPVDLPSHPATPERWPDLVDLFGERGACGGCWCMWWRKPRARFDREKGARNRADLEALVATGPPPGLIGYVAGQPAAWVALAPRSAYPVAGRSRIVRLDPGDRGREDEVWFVSCLFVDRQHR